MSIFGAIFSNRLIVELASALRGVPLPHGFSAAGAAADPALLKTLPAVVRADVTHAAGSFAGSATCTLSVTAGVNGNPQYSEPNFVVLHVFTDGQQNTGTSPSPSPSSSPPAPAGHLIRGYDGKCLDDAGDRAADRTKIQIWTCDQASAAEQWTYRKDELVDQAMCVNAKGTAKNGAPVILWSCTGTANEIWIHKPDGEYVLKAGGGKLCLTDPGRSTRNGTQLTVGTCANVADQHWALP